MNSIAWILSKLRFPLAVALGGTGKDTTAGLLTDLKTVGAYAKDNVIGTVSQTAGVPTGSIIETGTNTNGTYTKWADGTMICTKTFLTGVINQPAGALFTSLQVSGGNWAHPFITAPSSVVPLGVVTSAGGGWASCYGFSSATSAGSWAVYNHSSTSAGTVFLIAIGRWY